MILTGKTLSEVAEKIGKDLIIGTDSIDLRIGDDYLYYSREYIEDKYIFLRGGRTSHDALSRDLPLEKVTPEKDLCIRPGDFILIPTYEYIELPDNIMGMINLRSYAARAGIQQATALKISPGFKGIPILEISSNRYACVGYREPIAQLILFETTNSAGYNGRFQNQDKEILHRGTDME